MEPEDIPVRNLVQLEVGWALTLLRSGEQRGEWTFDDLNDAVRVLIKAANRVAPEGHRSPEG